MEDNKTIPIIGSIEEYTQNQIDTTFNRLFATTGTLTLIQATSKLIPVVGESVSKALERLDYFHSLLSFSLTIVSFEKFLFGIIAYLSLKCLMPFSLLLYALSRFRMLENLPIRKMSNFCMKIGVLFFLLVPTTAYINSSIEQALDVEQKIEYIKEQGEIFKRFENTCSIESDGWWGKTKDVGGCAIDFVKNLWGVVSDSFALLGKKMDEMVTIFANLVVIFLVTTIVVPIGVFAGFYFLLKHIDELMAIKKRGDIFHENKQKIYRREEETKN